MFGLDRRHVTVATCAALLLIVSAPLGATNTNEVPEIGGSAIAGALGLLASAVVIVRARFGKK